MMNFLTPKSRRTRDLWIAIGVLIYVVAVAAHFSRGATINVGTTGDDAANIRAAVGASGAGDTIVFPDKTYTLTAPVTWLGDRTYTGLAVLRKLGGKAAVVFPDGLVKNVVITGGMTFDGGGINMDSGDNIRIENCKSRNIGGGSGGDGCTFYSKGTITNSKIVWNTFSGCAGWGHVVLYGCENVAIEHNDMGETEQDVVHIFQRKANAVGVSVSYNTIHGCKRIGIEAQDGNGGYYRGLKIVGNQFRKMPLDWTKAGANLMGCPYSVPPQGSYDTDVIGNDCDDTCAWPLEYMSKGGRILNNIFDAYRGDSQSGSQRNMIMCDGQLSGPITFAGNVCADITGVHGGPNGVFPGVHGFPAGSAMGIESTVFTKSKLTMPAPIPAGAFQQGTTPPPIVIPPVTTMTVTGNASSSSTAVISLYDRPTDAKSFLLGLYPTSLNPKTTTVSFGVMTPEQTNRAVNTTDYNVNPDGTKKYLNYTGDHTTPSWWLTPVVTIVGGTFDGIQVVGFAFQCPLNTAGTIPPVTTQPTTGPTTQASTLDLKTYNDGLTAVKQGTELLQSATRPSQP